MAIGNAIGIPFLRRILFPPFYDDIELDYETRDGYNIEDNISGDLAEVVGGYEADLSPGTISIPLVTLVGDFSISFDYARTFDGSLEGIIYDASSSGFRLRNNLVQIIINSLTYSLGAVDLSGRNHYVLSRVGINVTLDVTGDVTYSNTVAASSDDFLISLIGDRGIGGLKAQGLLSSVILNAANIYYLNGNVINSVDGVAATNTGVTFQLNNSDQLASTLSALENGYYDDATNQIINPQYAQTTETLHSGGKMHNNIDSFIRFDAGATGAAKYDILDRSNVTTQTTASRDSVYYDSLDPLKYFAGKMATNELEYDTMQTYLEAAYKDRVFDGLRTNYDSVLNSFRFFTYGTVKTGQDLSDTLIYINYLYFFAGLVFYYASNSQYIPVIF